VPEEWILICAAFLANGEARTKILLRGTKAQCERARDATE
jgi:hypothetical protein